MLHDLPPRDPARRTTEPTSAHRRHGARLRRPHRETGEFDAAADRAEAVFATLGIPLVRVATNVRHIEHAWDDLVGPALASCLHLLQPNAMCVRTILAFRALGLGLPECFDEDVSDDQIRAVGRLDRHGRESLRILLDSVERTASSGSWVRALRSVYYRNVLRDLAHV